MPSRSGLAAMVDGLSKFVYQRKMKNGKHWQRQLVWMVSIFWKPYELASDQKNSGSWREWNSCGGCGFSNIGLKIMLKKGNDFTCGRMTTNLLENCGCIHPTMKMLVLWVGYKTHLSETCEPAEIHVITQVTTTLATEADMEALDTVHTNLADKNLLPKEHLVDGGYVDGDALTSAPFVNWSVGKPKLDRDLTWLISVSIGKTKALPVPWAKPQCNGANDIRKAVKMPSTFVFHPCNVPPAPVENYAHGQRVVLERLLSYQKSNISYYRKLEKSRIVWNFEKNMPEEPG